MLTFALCIWWKHMIAVTLSPHKYYKCTFAWISHKAYKSFLSFFAPSSISWIWLLSNKLVLFIADHYAKLSSHFVRNIVLFSEIITYFYHTSTSPKNSSSHYDTHLNVCIFLHRFDCFIIICWSWMCTLNHKSIKSL